MICYLVRHTAIAALPGTCYGQSEVPLAATYAQERERLRRQLPARVDCCLSSPLERCRRLAVDLYGPIVRCDNRLLELNFGAWEMQKWQDIDQKTARQWGDNFVTQPCPGGESFLQLQARVMACLQEVARSNSQRCVICTHAGAIRAAIAYTRHLPLAESFKQSIPPGSVTTLTLTAANAV